MSDLPEVLRRWQGSRCPTPTLKFPHSLFSCSPRPSSPSPHTTHLLGASHPALGPPLVARPPRPGLRLLVLVHQGAWVGSDWEQTPPRGALCILMAKSSVGGARKRGRSSPAHSVRFGSVPQGLHSKLAGPARGSPRGEEWRRIRSDRSPPPLKASDSTVFASTQAPESLPSCPRWGLVPGPPDKDGAVGADPRFKSSYNMEKLGFTRDVGDCFR